MTRKCKEETEKISETKTLKEKTPYNINRMEVIKTTVGHAIKQLFCDNIAFTIAAFLVEDLEKKSEEYTAFCATLLRKNDERQEGEISEICKESKV